MFPGCAVPLHQTANPLSSKLNGYKHEPPKRPKKPFLHLEDRQESRCATTPKDSTLAPMCSTTQVISKKAICAALGVIKYPSVTQEAPLHLLLR